MLSMCGIIMQPVCEIQKKTATFASNRFSEIGISFYKGIKIVFRITDAKVGISR